MKRIKRNMKLFENNFKTPMAKIKEDSDLDNLAKNDAMKDMGQKPQNERNKIYGEVWEIVNPELGDATPENLDRILGKDRLLVDALGAKEKEELRKLLKKKNNGFTLEERIFWHEVLGLPWTLEMLAEYFHMSQPGILKLIKRILAKCQKEASKLERNDLNR